MSGKPLKFPDFSDVSTPDSIKALNRIIMILFVINALLFLLWGDVYSFVFFILWISMCAAIFHYTQNPLFGRLAPVLYIPAVFGLSLIEETAIYFNGGGLQGAAASLSEDLVKSIPVFLMIALSLLIMNRIIPLSSGHFFLLGAIQGMIIEFIFGGAPLLFLGGITGLYGTMMSAYSPYGRKKAYGMKENTFILLLGTGIGFLFVLFGAAIADMLWKALGG